MGEVEPDLILFLEVAAVFFEKRPTGGEDRAHWANVYNAENCRKAAESLSAKDRMIEELRDVLRAIVPPKLCGESWNLPHGEKVSIIVTLDDISRARAVLDSRA